MAVFYLTWGMLAYILTLGKSSKNSRDLIYTGMIVMLVVEVSLSLQDVTLPEWFLPTVTEYEIVWLLKTLFPAYMNGCRCLGGFYYKDVEEETRQSLAALRDSHAVRFISSVARKEARPWLTTDACLACHRKFSPS